MVRPISYRAVCTEIYKHGDYKPHCQFHVIQYLADVLRKCRQLPLEFIAQKNFDSELQLINASLTIVADLV